VKAHVITPAQSGSPASPLERERNGSFGGLLQVIASTAESGLLLPARAIEERPAAVLLRGTVDNALDLIGASTPCAAHMLRTSQLDSRAAIDNAAGSAYDRNVYG